MTTGVELQSFFQEFKNSIGRVSILFSLFYFSDDKDYFRTQRDLLFKEKRSMTVNRELFPTKLENRPIAVKSSAPKADKRLLDTVSNVSVQFKLKLLNNI